MTRILHIAGGFAQHGLYTRLVTHLQDKGLVQHVYAPVRTAREESRQPDDVPGLVSYDFHRILAPRHRLLYRTKIRRIFNDVTERADLDSVDAVHAHTVYSDGGVALRLHRKLGLPYIVAVRNTDINYFMRYRPDLRHIMHAILQHACRVVFLSPAYIEPLSSRLPTGLGNSVRSKAVVIGNGIDDAWFTSGDGHRSDTSPELRLLYVGDFSKNKNVENTLAAAATIAARRPVRLTLVGGGGNHDARIRELLDSGRYPFAHNLGRIDNQDELRKIYRQNDVFVMPSFKESFGVVYLEALSQGLPIVHSNGQGIDGLFPEDGVSEGTDPHVVGSIVAAIETLADSPDSARDRCIAAARQFRWDRIADKYAALYRSICKESITPCS